MAVYYLLIAFIPVCAWGLYSSLGDYDGWQLHKLLEKRSEIARYMTEKGMTDNETVANEWQLFNQRLLQRFDDYVTRLPKNYENHQSLAELAVMNGDYDRAIATYRLLLVQFPNQQILLRI